MNTAIDTQLTVLQNKLQQLLKQYYALQKENEQLKKEIKKSKQIGTASSQKLQQLKTTNTTDIEKRIDKYVEEIDRCLLLLNTSV
ncbi:MAG: hypothetical protein KF781_07015 [Chitinophagaceae bacterium]|nr:hypothetical protein [Chitinophagaceae bacterium]MCW5904028.1 hypothetical protein [Chitinophagaceae bacterium]